MSRKGVLLFVAMCLLWGIPYLLIRVAVSELTPAMLVFSRAAIGALILVPFALARGDLRAVLRRWLPLVAFAVLEMALPWLLLSNAEVHVSSSLAGLMIAAVPLVTAVIAIGLGQRDSLGIAGFAGLLVGLAGVGAIVGFNLGTASAGGLIELAGVVVCYAVGPLILERYLSALPPVSVVGFSVALSAVAFALAAAVQWPHAAPEPQVLASVAALAILCTVVAFLLYAALIAEIGAVRATVITYINPAVAALAGVLLLHEMFTAPMAAGLALVILGSVFATGRGGRSLEVSPAAATESAGR